jgi:hypothetical protein
MPTTTPDSIYYPDSSSQIAPLETHFATLATSVQNALTARVGAKLMKVADHAALILATSGVGNGDVATVESGGAIFVRTAGAWEQKTPAKFTTTTVRDSEYAKAGAAYRVLGARAIVTASGTEFVHNGTGWVAAVPAFLPTYNEVTGTATVPVGATLAALTGSNVSQSITNAAPTRAKVTVRGIFGSNGSGTGAFLNVAVSGSTTRNPASGDPSTALVTQETGSAGSNSFMFSAVLSLSAGANVITLVGQPAGSGGTRTVVNPVMIVEPFGA